ncbi:MED13-like protein, partial [Mya arenaria]
LSEHEYGSWEKDSVLSYECRTLLFKALHNLIERCLLAKNFVRLGRWFVQSQDPLAEQSASLSFCFNFFLHGESTVCASIEVKQHAPVTLLTVEHLNHSQESGAQLNVILAPYGLNGSLTGVTYRDSDLATRKNLDDWKQFYPVRVVEGADTDHSKLPNLVEVIVAGVRMKYPSCYVLLVDEAYEAHRQVLHGAGLLGHGHMEEGLLLDAQHRARGMEPMSEVTAKTNHLFSSKMVERISQDSCITAGMSKRCADSTTEDGQTGIWNFADPCSKSACNCSRLRGAKNKASSGMPGKQLDKKKGDRGPERQQSRMFRSAPFHRRNQTVDDFVQYDMDAFVSRIPQGMSQNSGVSASNSASTPIPQGSTSAGSEGATTVGTVNIESPASNVPSPLEDSHNHANLEGGVAMDPTMPTLSPHPPALKHGDKEMGGANKPVQSVDPSTSQNVNIGNNTSVMVNGVTSDNNAFHKPLLSNVLKLDPNSGINNSINWNQQSLESTKANINSWLRSQQKQSDHKTFKRPCLPTVDGDTEQLATDSLYNFDSVSNWSEFPLKKMCLDRSSEMLNGIQDTHINFGQNHRPMKAASPLQPPAPDPYAFSDEASSTPATLSRSVRNSRDDIFQRPFKEEEKSGENFGFKDERNMDIGSLTSPPTTPGTQVSGSLTREEDLKPKACDLDKIFDSDSDSNDDAFMQPSPPKSVEEPKLTKLPNTGPVDALGVIAPAELSRMYPTPPSHETNPDCSPLTHHEAHIEAHPSVIEGIPMAVVKTEVTVGTSLADDLNKEGVYQPDVRAKYPSSTKYAPVELYSSQLSPPPAVPEYKASWFHHPIHIPLPDKHVSQYINIPSIENLPSIPSSRMPSSAIEASPATFQNSVGQQRTPMSYELQSPASNASSYLNKTPNSNLNHHVGTNNQIPEAHSLLVNVVLSDSILNLFKDQNFDSCNICVCNMTIKGSDLGVYIPNPTGEQEYKCTCGFSAVMNRRYGYEAGLFYEDEVEITGMRDDRLEQKRKRNLLTLGLNKVDETSATVTPPMEEVSQSVMLLLLGQFTVPYPTCTAAALRDRLVMHCKTQTGLHCSRIWHQGVSQLPQNSQESVRLLKGLQPLLQDAIQNKRVTRLWEHTYKLQGPLTWIEFHQLAGRGSDENSETQPIPSLLVGYDKDSSNVSPYALRYWDKNLLEPYGHRRDVAYVVVTPDNDFIIKLVQPFFKELSTMYEWLRLGRHSPIDKLRDGIFRIGPKQKQKVDESFLDEWFKYIPNNHVSSNLKLYALSCKMYLAELLNQQDYKMMFAASTSSQKHAHQRPPDHGTSEYSSSHGADDRDGDHRDSHDDVSDGTGQGETPALVVYMINPFTFGVEWDEINRLAMMGLLRCYQETISKLPDFMQNNVYLQIIPVQTIIDAKESAMQFQLLKNIAFSVFTSCRWNLSHTILGRSLTGFGPAAGADIILKRQGNVDTTLCKLYNPPFVLAPIKDKQEQLAESCSEKMENSTILMCVYCLSEDQRWLLACCTDEHGETVETSTINIDIPNRNRRKKTSARKIGLGKLWDFIIGVISMSAKPCRLVIGRFGRIGHGELKGWSGLLSKKNIQRCNKRMREMCSSCSHQVEGEHPTIVSACLISFEQHRSFSITPDCVKAEEKQRRNCPLQTPGDASCSHILVFPTSATAQANTQQNQLDSTGGIDLGGHNLEFGVDLSDTNIINDFDTPDEFANLMDVFVSMTENSPPGSPRQDNPGSPGHLDLGRNSPNKMNGVSMASSAGHEKDPQDDAPNLLQQPLAMGYYISTAQTGPLPRWFWSACPDNEHAPVKCFKSALHVHVSTNQDDFMHQTSPGNSHPLDSNLTCDVLRFVLEKYNALSWLTFDPAKNDRQSCLPLHMVVLMQLYHAMNAFI